MNDVLGKKAPIARELLQAIRRSFEQIEDPRRCPGSIPLADALMSAVAMFALKLPSLLKFDEQRKEAVIRANLRELYGVEHAPCDSQCGSCEMAWRPSGSAAPLQKCTVICSGKACCRTTVF